MEFDIRDYLKEIKPCTKVVHRSKYEKPEPEVFEWWSKLFKDLEEKSVLPNYKKRNVLRQTYSIETYDDLVNIGVDILDELKGDLPEKKSAITDRSTQTEVKKQKVNKYKQKEPTNPYVNLIKKSHKDAQIWRPQKKAALKDLELVDKAVNVTDNIATGFMDWFNSMGGSDKKSEIDKDVLLEIFKIQFNYPAATSLCTKPKELKSVPRNTAAQMKRSEFSQSKCIRREIKNDVKQVKKAPPKVAFGSTLPKSMRVNLAAGDADKKWLSCYVYHDELTSMEKCFDEITELQSVRSFCDWLLRHPEIPLAQYLVDAGLTEPKNLSRPIHSAYQVVEGEPQFELGSLEQSTTDNLKRPSGVLLPSVIFESLRHSSKGSTNIKK